MRIGVHSVGIAGPGLDDWSSAHAVLTGDKAYQADVMRQTIPALFSPTERRRSSRSARLAVTAAEDALRGSLLPKATLATLFASSDGDGEITHHICTSLAMPAHEVSPTAFHNSVYNAPAGYWSIGAQSRAASTSLCAYDHSFAAGLLQAAAYVVAEEAPILLIAYDLPFPPPLHSIRAVEETFAVALLLTPPTEQGTIMHGTITLTPPHTPTPFPAWVPESLRTNPAARALPLLCVLAARHRAGVALNYADDRALVILCEPTE